MSTVCVSLSFGILVLPFLISSVASFNILILPSMGRSHLLSLSAIADGLVALNHSVTVVVRPGQATGSLVDAVANNAGCPGKAKTGQRTQNRQDMVRYEMWRDDENDSEAILEELTLVALEKELRMDALMPAMRNRYVDIFCFSRSEF